MKNFASIYMEEWSKIYSYVFSVFISYYTKQLNADILAKGEGTALQVLHVELTIL